MEREKRIAVYLYDIAKPYVGLGEFEHNIALRIGARAAALKADYGVTVCFLVPPGKKGFYGTDVEYITLWKWRYHLLNCPLPAFIKRFFFPRADLVHWTQQLPRLRTCLSRYTFVTIHDVNFFHNGIPKSKIKQKRKRIQRTLNHATHLSFISHFTQEDVKKHFDIHVPARVILNGVTDQTQLLQEKVEGIPDRYFLCVSGLDSKKNVHLLVEMMRYLPNEFLVVAGRGSTAYTQYLYRLVERYRLTNIRFVGCVDSGRKAFLYKGCKAFLFPSRSEGFGLPVAEAMTFGKPCFISSLTSLPEIGGDTAYYFTELTPRSMAADLMEGMKAYENDPEAKRRHILAHVRKFDWDKAASAYIDFYLEILGCR